MSDSKGAAIDDLLMELWITDPYKVKYTEVIPKAKQAILAILAQEVKRVRIEELKNIENLSDGQTQHLNSAHDNYILKVNRVIDRIKDLERLG